MVNFSCDNCGRQIKAPDKLCGRRVKCPKCSSVCVVPEMPAKIRFLCKSCGHKISVPETHAGKKGKCPKCKTLVVVPRTTGSSITADRHASDVKISPKNADLDGLLLDVQQKREVPAETTEQDSTYEDLYDFGQTVEQRLQAEQDEHTGERKLPWFVDIFLYPLSISGLINLVVFLCAPIFIGLIYQFILNYIWPVGELIVLILYLLFVGYVLYYLSWCVIDSTKGRLRAPDIAFQPSPAKEELLGQVGILLACIAICFWPVAVYHILTGKTDFLYWLLTAVGLLIFPMALLAGFLYDSIGELNPILIVKSVIKTFPAYLPVVIFFAGLFAVFNRVTPQLPQSESLESMLFYLSQVINIIFNARSALRLTGFIYLTMVGAHILGRFYWKYREKLNWEV